MDFMEVGLYNVKWNKLAQVIFNEGLVFLMTEFLAVIPEFSLLDGLLVSLVTLIV
jgi:hypothetical protein